MSSSKNLIRLSRKEIQRKRPPTVDRSAILSLENDICELATAAELSVDLHTDGDSNKTSFVLDQVERIAKQLKGKYYGVLNPR
jgi:hypothetical protein